MIDAFVLLQFQEDKDDHTYGGHLEPVGVTFKPKEASDFTRGWGSKRQVMRFELKTDDAPVGETFITIRVHEHHKTFETIRHSDGDTIENATNIFTLMEDALGLVLANNQTFKVKFYLARPLKGAIKIPPDKQVMNLVNTIADLTLEGEKVPGVGKYHQEPDDAVEALQNLIRKAREIVDEVEWTKRQKFRQAGLTKPI